MWDIDPIPSQNKWGSYWGSGTKQLGIVTTSGTQNPRRTRLKSPQNTPEAPVSPVITDPHTRDPKTALRGGTVRNPQSTGDHLSRATPPTANYSKLTSEHAFYPLPY